MKQKLCLCFLLTFILSLKENGVCFCQETQENRVKIAFYNVENLFDTADDPFTNDDEFAFKGIRAWNSERYKKKLHRLAQVIIGLGKWKMPVIIGLCEVENLQLQQSCL